MMPLSIENESLGKPAMPHSRIATGSPRHETSENFAELGMPSARHCSTHEAAMPSRNAIVNVPR